MKCFCGRPMRVYRDTNLRAVVLQCSEAHKQYLHDDGRKSTDPKLTFMGREVESMDSYHNI